MKTMLETQEGGNSQKIGNGCQVGEMKTSYNVCYNMKIIMYWIYKLSVCFRINRGIFYILAQNYHLALIKGGRES